MALHSALTGSELHENKGVAAASNNTVATAASSATVWQKVNSNMIDTASIFDTNRGVISAVIDDVSTAGTVYIVFPFAVTINKIRTVLGGAITGADSVITVRNHSGGSMGTLTIANSGSAAGDIDSLNPSSNNTIAADNKMSIETDGASTGAQKLYITVQFTATS